MDHDFPLAGFLSEDASKGISQLRYENLDWFTIAENLNRTLMRVQMTAIDMPEARCGNWSKEAVSIRLLMRSCVSLQGVILMAERGMIVPARTLVRAIIEDSFVAGALTTMPDEVIDMLRNGAEASRKFQADFIVAQKLGDNAEDLDKLEKAIDKMDSKAKFLRPRKIAGLSSMLPQYLNYMRLSDDSAHTSASSLNKHIAVRCDRSGWSYRIGPAQKDDVASTLHRAVLAALPMGIVVNQLMPDQENNLALLDIANSFRTLPTGSVI